MPSTPCLTRFFVSLLALSSMAVSPAGGQTINETVKLLPNDGISLDVFGFSVAINGTTAVVGAFHDDDNGDDSGSAYLFETTVGQQIAKLLPSDGETGDQFGYSVAISGTTAVVGAPNDDDNGTSSGSAYLFDTTTGQQLFFKLLPNDGAESDQFGYSVAISGTTAVVGAYSDDDNGGLSGSVYLFDTVTGQQIAKLLPSDGAAGDFFGISVAISGTTAVVGASGDDDNGNLSGSAYLFDTVTGQQIAKLLPSDGAANDQFGFSVSISGTTAVVGADRDGDNGLFSGSAYLFDTVTGQQIAKLLPSDGAALDQFGLSVSISGTTVVVGASGDDDNGSFSGSAYLFSLNTDTDGDGLTDDWEINGIPYTDGNGVLQRLQLPDANPLHKDLYIEIDSMVGRGFDKVAQVNVVVAFAQAPNALVNNPDGLDGIALHLVVDEENLPLIPFPDNWVQFDMVKANHFGTTAEQGNAPLLEAKAKAYRYCVFGQSHGATDSSGLAELPGNDFMVTLGLWNTPGGTIDQQAGTFMHELGHTLNLGHGGVSNAGVVSNLNNKPNYYSVMNYIWQYPHANYARFWRLDYSHVALATLNEAALVEGNGIDGSDPDFAAAMTPFGNGAEPPVLRWAKTDGSPVDWNGNGMTDPNPVGVDLNYHESCVFPCPTVGDVLVGGNDWSNLWYRLSGHGNFADGVHTDTTLDTEMTVEIFDRIAQTPPPPCGDADLNGDGSLNFFDVSAFLTAYLAQDPAADFTGDGLFNFFDVSAFLVAYQTGCP
ncbi:MAG: hypothetical protein KDA29_07220 [Phycisphaerales bacterium]|nr:hypothetical protein [Phycisphaerales bacterium]